MRKVNESEGSAETDFHFHDIVKGVEECRKIHKTEVLKIDFYFHDTVKGVEE